MIFLIFSINRIYKKICNIKHNLKCIFIEFMTNKFCLFVCRFFVVFFLFFNQCKAWLWSLIMRIISVQKLFKKSESFGQKSESFGQYFSYVNIFNSINSILCLLKEILTLFHLLFHPFSFIHVCMLLKQSQLTK